MSEAGPSTPCPVRLAAQLRGIVRGGVIEAAPVRVEPSSDALLERIGECCSALRQEHGGRSPREIGGLKAARKLYRAFGIDPTKIRPSSEALLRRVLADRPLPRILNAVDLCNHFSLSFLLPIGLYDSDKISGPVTLRRGAAGESYPGIRRDEIHLEGRPVVADPDGPFGNPTADSLRTCVSTSTRSLLMVIFAPQSVPRDSLFDCVRTAEGLMREHLSSGDEPTVTRGFVIDDSAD